MISRGDTLAFRTWGLATAAVLDLYDPDAHAAFVGGLENLPLPPAPPVSLHIFAPGVRPMLAITAITIADDDAPITLPIAYDDKFQDSEPIAPGTALTLASDDAAAFIAAPTLDPTGVGGIVIGPAGAGKLGTANVTLSDAAGHTANLAVTVKAGAAATLVIGAVGSV